MATMSKNTPPREAANVAVAKKPGDANSSNRAFRLILLVLMVLQNTATVLVGRYSRASVSKEDSYVVNHLIVTCEAVKVRAFGLDWFGHIIIKRLCNFSAHVVSVLRRVCLVGWACLANATLTSFRGSYLILELDWLHMSMVSYQHILHLYLVFALTMS